MASPQPSPSETCPLKKHLTCSICLDIFVNPVTTACGHSFCEQCLNRNLALSDGDCPLCKQHQSRTPQVNIVLRDLVEQMAEMQEKEKEREKEREAEREREKVREIEREVERDIERERERRRQREREIESEREEQRQREREIERERQREREMEKEREREKERARKDQEYTGAPGEVACDVCAEPKLKAEKSCLMCLASYCSAHLQSHASTERLNGHKLVEPVKNLDERACLKHGRPLELYSRKTGECICVLCLEEGQEGVVPTEAEWTKKKNKLADTKTDLQQKIKNRKTQEDQINESLKSCQGQVEDAWWDIDAVFTAVIAIVENAQATALKPLEDRRQAVEKRAKDLKEGLKKEINLLDKTISELDDLSALEDHILFLKSYPSLKEIDEIKYLAEVDFDTSLSFGTLRKTTTVLLKQIQQELEKLTSIELRRVPKFSVDVKMDPATAHQRLVLSKDGKEVKDGGEDQKVDDAPERFDLFGSILGCNKFTSGRSYWEVEVDNKTGWDLGVAKGNAERKGKLSLNPDNGYWVTVNYEDEKFAAMTAPPVRLSLKDKPKKVGVFVDYEEGLVSFYDVTAQSHIHTFTECSFNGAIYPYFSPHFNEDGKNLGPLIISAVKPCELGMDTS